MGTIRLGCRFCDRVDGNGLIAIPIAWFNVEAVQSFAASQQPATGDQNHFAWYTHLGVCPECQESELGPANARLACC